ncbi:hypothetical protein ATCC90586_006606 [Pythium insidiosum]|nr:hypothetical protein ATCC90586_006606 [Pythium insidiosum]
MAAPLPHSSASDRSADEKDTGSSVLAVASRLDYSCLRDADGQLVSLFQDPRVAIDVAVDQTLAIAFVRSLYIAPAIVAQPCQAPVVLQRVSEGREYLEEENSNEIASDDADTVITDLKWINREFFATSDSTGVLRLYSRDGVVRFAQDSTIAIIHIQELLMRIRAAVYVPSDVSLQ